MKQLDCEFESEVLAAVLQSRWSDPVNAHLVEHVTSCTICSDVLAIAGVMNDAYEEVRARAVVPDSGRVWWLAQMRARREATKAAGRPITAAQVIAFACAMGLLGACFGATSTWFQLALGRITTSVAGFKMQELFSSAIGLIAAHGAVVLAMAGVLFLVPAAVYLVLLRD